MPVIVSSFIVSLVVFAFVICPQCQLDDYEIATFTFKEVFFIFIFLFLWITDSQTLGNLLGYKS